MLYGQDTRIQLKGENSEPGYIAWKELVFSRQTRLHSMKGTGFLPDYVLHAELWPQALLSKLLQAGVLNL